MAITNPFEVTKATDFADDQIDATWVDLPGGGFKSLVNPHQPMPHLLIGGKGGGRTHVMRHFSFNLQRLRGGDALSARIAADGYIGIYLRCGGMNSSRFRGKGQEVEVWDDVFAYYMDLWLAQVLVSALVDLTRSPDNRISSEEEEKFCEAVLELFDETVEAGPVSTIAELYKVLHSQQRNIDVSINNAALSRKLDVRIAATRGRLVFGVPAAASSYIESLRLTKFIYLLDEFENMDAEQQKYVNTLIREKVPPSNIFVGSRRYGIRTQRTLGSGEENRAGSEYYETILEDVYRLNKSHYSDFCKSLIARRIEEVGAGAWSAGELERFFEAPRESDPFSSTTAREYVGDRPSLERPYMRKLRRQLVEFRMEEGISDKLVEALAIEDFPVLERWAVFLFYQEWARGHQLTVELARMIRERALAQDARSRSRLALWKGDLVAQIAHSFEAHVSYLGLDTFISMSGYLPRNLLIILKQVTRWSEFLDENPFSGGTISRRAQELGVKEASEWFLADAKALGSIGEDSQSAVRRLGTFLRAFRFADKPTEVSPCTFSIPARGLSLAAQSTLQSSVEHSLILDIRSGHRGKNMESHDLKYQLNPMLSPMYDLPLSRRGVVGLTSREAEAIFNPEASADDLRVVSRIRLRSMTAPFRDSRGPDDSALLGQGMIDLD